MGLDEGTQDAQGHQPPEQRAVPPRHLRKVGGGHHAHQGRARHGEHARQDGGGAVAQALDQRDARDGRRCGFLVLFGMAHQHGQFLVASLRIPQIRLERSGELLHRAVAFLAVRVECEKQHVVRFRVHAVPAQRRQHQLGVLDGGFGTLQVGRQEGVLPRQHLVGQAGKRPFVAARIQAFLAHLLERHVADGASACSPEPACVGERGQAKVGYLHLALAVDEHVVRLDVQMEHLVVVRDHERVGDR